MPDEIVPVPAVNALIREIEKPGPGEMSHLTTELNALNKMQLEALSNMMPWINDQLGALHPGTKLPQLELDWGGAGHSGPNWDSTADFTLRVKGTDQELYRREFTENSKGEKSDIKFDPLDHKQSSIDTSYPDGSHSHGERR